ncbi:uncharacterized protein LOC141607082 isoform X2 [Silene latifolia]|uniref:uncharacterized protein LOC141607082 isoform X2 n=1 Tax=Silene latifolia TaxID=37657 RepID=UPI003D785C02
MEAEAKQCSCQFQVSSYTTSHYEGKLFGLKKYLDPDLTGTPTNLSDLSTAGVCIRPEYNQIKISIKFTSVDSPAFSGFVVLRSRTLIVFHDIQPSIYFNSFVVSTLYNRVQFNLNVVGSL